LFGIEEETERAREEIEERIRQAEERIRQAEESRGKQRKVLDKEGKE
jgi:hypothetical protein